MSVADRWQALIAGALGFFAAIAAVLITLGSERRERSANSRTSVVHSVSRFGSTSRMRSLPHLECRARLHMDEATEAIMIEDRARLPLPSVYPHVLPRVGDFGEPAKNILLFYNRIAVAREAAERLRGHSQAQNLPKSEIAQAADALIKIAETGVKLLPFLQTRIATEDNTDQNAIEMVGKASGQWAASRNSFAQFRS